MAKPYTAKEIRERRERITILRAKGFTHGDIARGLGISRQTLSKDYKFLNEMSEKWLFDLANHAIPTMYFNCIQGIDEVQKEAWKIFRNQDNNPRITEWIKIAALRIVSEVNEKKFGMFQNGPAIMQIRKLYDRIDELKKQVFGEGVNNNNNTFRSNLPYRPDIRDLDLDRP